MSESETSQGSNNEMPSNNNDASNNNDTSNNNNTSNNNATNDYIQHHITSNDSSHHTDSKIFGM